MVPDVFMRLDAMPQTAGGKIDYKCLECEEVDWRTEYREPTNRVERIVCEAVASVLGKERVGADDDFFELGGDSLGAVELMLVIENKLGDGDIVPEYGDIYRYPTPALLTEKILSGGVPEAYPIKQLNYDGVGDYLISSDGATSERRSLGNVLLTGATGYLGNHILAELLRGGRCEKVFCLVRSKKNTSAKKRVTSALFYYAENDFSEPGKWEAVEGDISLEMIFAEPFGEKIDTVINCAANVAHFAYGDALVKANETGVKNLIAFAKKQGARFCQISTVSVGGLALSGQISQRMFTERNLYIGQQIFNEYVYTKYMAEYALLRAAAEDELDVQIMRVGNLQGRLSDGEFQMNMRSNAFTRKLSAYIDMGAVPQSVYASDVEFSPVDEVAAMIVALAETSAHGAFHVCPPVEMEFKRLFAVLSELGKTVEPVSDEAFGKLLGKFKVEGRCKESVEALSIEKQDGDYLYIPFSRERTVGILKKLGKSWKPVTDEYLKKYLTALAGMDMF